MKRNYETGFKDNNHIIFTKTPNVTEILTLDNSLKI